MRTHTPGGSRKGTGPWNPTAFPVSVRHGHRLHRGGNRQVNRTLHSIAMVQARVHGPAREFARAKEADKGKKGAYRALKRHLVDVVYRTMLAGRAAARQDEEAYRPAA